MSTGGEDEPSEIMIEAEGVISNLLPEKSKKTYEKAYRAFKEWCGEMNVTSVTENVMLTYFSRKASVQKSSTLWTYYSMLRSTLLLFVSVDISKYHKLQAFLKRESKGHKPKKSMTLTRQQLETFLTNAPDEFLLIKVAALFGVYGACRTDELVHLRTTDVQDLGSSLVVNVYKTKTQIERVFSIVDKPGKNYLDSYRRYVSLRPQKTEHDRFFIYYKNGICSIQPVGKNTMAKFPSMIAKFLNLDKPELFTGHCFRRTSATLLVESGGDLITLKRHGGWKSSAVAEGYVDSSLVTKRSTAMKIMAVPEDTATPGHSNFTVQHPETTEGPTTEEENVVISAGPPRSRGPTIHISNCSNCQINIKID